MSLLINKCDDNKETKIFEFIGEIDLNTIEFFKSKINEEIENLKSNLIFDFAKLEYIDSLGLGVLVSILKKIKGFNKEVELVNLKPNVKKLFVITGLDKVFVIKEC
jgi:anti-sigma B factor antagonist